MVCHGSLNPEVQYVYHCTTHVPYNTAYANAKHFSIRRETETEEDERLTFTTTANTIGPKIIFMFMSMLPKSLDNKSRKTASGGGGTGVETTRYEGRRRKRRREGGRVKGRLGVVRE